MSTITNYNKLTSQEWNALYDSLMTEKNPNTDTLKQFLDAPYKKVFTQADSEQYHYDYIKALQLKLETLTKEPTPIEKNNDPLAIILNKQSNMDKQYETKGHH